MNKILDWLSKKIVANTIEDIDRLREGLSAYGYLEEAYQIGSILTQIKKAEKEKVEALLDEPLQ